MRRMKPEMDKNLIPKGYRTVVGVSHINTPTDFYVNELADWSTLLELSRKLKSYTDTLNKPTILKENDLCMAYYEGKHWCRARVRKVLGPCSHTTCGSDEVEIVYIDFGNTDTFAVDRLRFLPAEFADAPSMAHHCSLFGIYPPANTWTQRGIHAFWKMIYEQKVLMYVMGYEQDMYIVDLGELNFTDYSTVPISTRDALIFCGHAYFTPTSVSLAQRPLKVLDQFIYNRFNKGRTFAVYLGHLDTPSDFYVRQIGDNLFTLNEEINLECNSTQTKCMGDMPRIGMACAAICSLDNSWYRAKVMAVSSGALVEVIYVDYGNRELVEWKTLKMLQKKFFKLPAQGIRCTLTDIVPCNGPTWPYESKDFLEQTLGDNRLLITINKIESEKHSVTLYKLSPSRRSNLNINDMLVMQGFANSVGHRTVKTDKFLKLQRDFEALGITASGTSVYPCERGKNTANSSRTRLVEDTKMYYGGFASQAGHKFQALRLHQSNLRYSEFKIPNLECWTVTVPAILSPTSVFIQLCHMENGILQDTNEQFKQLSAIIQIQAPSQPLLIEHRIGQVCCTRYSQNDVWYRAIILSVNKYAVKVEYVDYGNEENQPLDMVRQLKPEWCELPIQGVTVKFWNIEEVENTIYGDKFFGDLSNCLKPRVVAQIKVWEPEVQGEFVEENNCKHLAYQQLLDDGLLRMMPGK